MNGANSSRLSGYRFEDLVSARIVKNRSDLHNKQVKFGFPRPVKLSARTAWFPAEEVNEWLSRRAQLRKKVTAE
jgi:predicted DNA-binding transcriptional regulator AlpA